MPKAIFVDGAGTSRLREIHRAAKFIEFGTYDPTYLKEVREGFVPEGIPVRRIQFKLMSETEPYLYESSEVVFCSHKLGDGREATVLIEGGKLCGLCNEVIPEKSEHP